MSALSDFAARVDALARTGVPRAKAARDVAAADPDLQRRVVAEANSGGGKQSRGSVGKGPATRECEGEMQSVMARFRLNSAAALEYVRRQQPDLYDAAMRELGRGHR